MAKNGFTFKTDRIKLNYDEIGKLLKSNEMQALIHSYAQDYAEPGDRIFDFKSYDRVHSCVFKNDKNKK